MMKSVGSLMKLKKYKMIYLNLEKANYNGKKKKKKK